MKRKISYFILGMLLFPCVVLADPFLVCDPPEEGQNVEYYLLTGLSIVQPDEQVPLDTTGQFGFKLDLSGLPFGNYTVTGMACNKWGCSEASVPFEFTKIVPSVPSNFNISR